MKTLETIYNKLNSVEKTELETHKVDLAIVDDLKRLVNALGSQLSIDDKVLPESEKLVSELSSSIPKAKERAKTNKSIINGIDGKIDLAENALTKAKQIAKELGVNVKEISNFSQVEKLLKEVKENKKGMLNLTGRLNDLLK